MRQKAGGDYCAGKPKQTVVVLNSKNEMSFFFL